MRVISKALQQRSKMRHIDLKQQWVRDPDLRDKKVVKLEKIPGTENPADGLTKILSGPEFVRAAARYRRQRE